MERADVQGLLLFAYKRHPCSRFYLLRFDGGQPRQWLRRVLTDVTSGQETEAGRYRFNVAFSARGLSALGLDEQDLNSFQREFVQGMAHPERSFALGDRDRDDPSTWQWGNAREPVDAIALLYARTSDELLERSADVEKLLAKFGIAQRFEEVSLASDGREHFGFVDGLSQPFVRGSGRRLRPGDDKIATGEFVLGYTNAYGTVSRVPRARRRRGTREHPFPLPGTDSVGFGHNGSYLVVRKLQQDVAAFWRYCWDAAHAERASDPKERAKWIAARFVGRWPNGVSLVDAPEAERTAEAALNDFRFRELDPVGMRCPLGAHVRRANPRDMLGDDARQALREANLHRIIRRGRSYGPRLPGEVPLVDDGAERGLCFVALNANLRRQFEFIQQTWLNNCKFGGLSQERDPLIGSATFEPGDEAAARVFSVPGRPVRTRYEGLPKFVQTRGGEYFFLPSLRALNFLCDGEVEVATR